MPDKPKFQKPKHKSVDEFARGAYEEERPGKGFPAGDYPWNAPEVRDNLKKALPLYLPEPYALKIKWLAEQTGIPQQRILREMLLPQVDAKIEELIGKEDK